MVTESPKSSIPTRRARLNWPVAIPVLGLAALTVLCFGVGQFQTLYRPAQYSWLGWRIAADEHRGGMAEDWIARYGNRPLTRREVLRQLGTPNDRAAVGGDLVYEVDSAVSSSSRSLIIEFDTRDIMQAARIDLSFTLVHPRWTPRRAAPAPPPRHDA